MFTLQNLTNTDNITLRNLEEQVQKNKEDIARHYEIDRAESNLGIKIIGQVSTSEELPDPLTYTGQYGDTYAVGYKAAVDAGTASYDYWVFTRPTPNTGVFENQWLNVGKISIVGPKGDTGKTGATGPAGKSTKWYTGAYFPSTSDLTTGDMYLNNQGEVFQYSEETGWSSVTNIQGPTGQTGKTGERGPVGEKGEQGIPGPVGPAGGFINIYGILTNESQLPTPQSLNNLTAAYLIGTDNPRTLWIQVSSDGTVANAIWREAGPFNTATQVTVGGQYVSEWNADSKRDLIQPEAGKYKLYACGPTGQAEIQVGTQSGQIPQYFDYSSNRVATGYLYTNTASTNQPNAAVNVQYIDNHVVRKVDMEQFSDRDLYSLVARNSTGGLTRFRIQNNNELPETAYTVPVYRNGGELLVKNSQSSSAAVNNERLEEKLELELSPGSLYIVMYLQNKTTGEKIQIRIKSAARINNAYFDPYGYQGEGEEEGEPITSLSDDQKDVLMYLLSGTDSWAIPTDAAGSADVAQFSNCYLFRPYSYGLNYDDLTINADIILWNIDNNDGTNRMSILIDNFDWYIIGLYSDV